MRCNMQKITRTMVFLTLALSEACGNTTTYNSGLVTGKKDQSSADKDEADSENTPADEPQQVSGAFLHLAFMDDEATLRDAVRTRPDGYVRVGAAFVDKKTRRLAKIDGLKVSWLVVTPTKTYEDLDFEWPKAGQNLHYIINLKVRDIFGTISSRVSDGGAKKKWFARSMTTVSEFGGGNIDSDIRKLGITAPVTDGTVLGKSAAGKSTAPTEEQVAAVAGNDTNYDAEPFWLFVRTIVEKTFGQLYTAPPTSFNGAVDLKECTGDSCGDKKFVVAALLPTGATAPAASSGSGTTATGSTAGSTGTKSQDGGWDFGWNQGGYTYGSDSYKKGSDSFQEPVATASQTADNGAAGSDTSTVVDQPIDSGSSGTGTDTGLFPGGVGSGGTGASGTGTGTSGTGTATSGDGAATGSGTDTGGSTATDLGNAGSGGSGSGTATGDSSGGSGTGTDTDTSGGGSPTDGGSGAESGGGTGTGSSTSGS